MLGCKPADISMEAIPKDKGENETFLLEKEDTKDRLVNSSTYHIQDQTLVLLSV